MRAAVRAAVLRCVMYSTITCLFIFAFDAKHPRINGTQASCEIVRRCDDKSLQKAAPHRIRLSKDAAVARMKVNRLSGMLFARASYHSPRAMARPVVLGHQPE